MMIKVFNISRVARTSLALLAIAFLITAVNVSNMKATGVFSQTREIPIYGVSTQENKIALTFDCAWGAQDIPEILDTLKKHEAKATFFIVGQWAEKNPEAVKMIIEQGHELGSHGYSHLRMSLLGTGRIRDELQKAENVVKELTGVKMNLFRPPYGDYDNEVILTAKSMGYYSIQWNADSLDWKESLSREDIIQRVVNKTAKGSIILMHNDTKHTAKALPDILESLKKKGFIFVRVNDLILKDNYKLNDKGIQIRTN